MRDTDYVQKLANNIEKKLNMNSNEIKKLSRSEFKSLLKNGYFSQKVYINPRYREPTDKQLDVLDLHYGRPVRLTQQATPSSHKYFYSSRQTGTRVFPDYIRKNKGGRIIDSRTGRFVSTVFKE